MNKIEIYVPNPFWRRVQGDICSDIAIDGV